MAVDKDWLVMVTKDQINKRDFWEKKLANKECSLSDAIFFVMASGAPATQFLLDCYEKAIIDYQDGVYSDLAIPFGIEMSQKQKNVEKNKTKNAQIIQLIEAYAELGFKRNNPENYQNTVYHKVAEEFGLSPSTVFDIAMKKRSNKIK